MLCTTEEAEKKICCFPEVIIGADKNTTYATNCLADSCMAWKWNKNSWYTVL